jgi:very-short-patch-repair endonuclease
MSAVDDCIAGLGEGQLSLVTHVQLVKAGVHEDDIDSRVRRRGLLLVYRGVYRIPGGPTSYRQSVMAACLATGGFASHRTAARLFGLRGFDFERRVEITVPKPRGPRLEGVTAHKCNLLETTTIGVIPAVMPGQVLLGLAEVASRRAEGAVNDVLVKGLATLPALVRFAQRQSARGRGGIVRLRELLEEQVRAGAATESWLEDQLLAFLRERGFPEPVRQYRVGKCRLDLVWPEPLVDLEADGRLWHTSPSDRRRDAARDAALEAKGISVERVTWLELKEDPDGLEARLWRCYGNIKAAA